ncbi:hypothetical protein Tco_0592484 [Tanacetum coccineum]
MSAMADTTPVIATVKNTGAKEKAPNETDAMPRANILNFCEEHYDDILPIIMDRIRRDKRKEVQTRLDFDGSSKKTRKARDYSLSSSDGSPPARHRHTLEKSKTYGWRRNDDKSVFNRLSHRKKSAFERLSDTYSPSTTKSRPSRASSRDHSQGRNRPRVKDLLRGVEESYGDTQSSRGTKTKYRDRSYDEDHSRRTKKRRSSESPSSRISASSTSNGGRWKSKGKRHGTTDEDLAVPWTCEDVDPFTPRIRNFQSSRKTRMPNNVKTYDGTGDPEDHLKIFQAAAQVER